MSIPRWDVRVTLKVNETSGSDFKGDKDIKDPEACRDGEEEIAGYDPLRLILKKKGFLRKPSLTNYLN